MPISKLSTQQSIGIPEPLFIDGEPMIALEPIPKSHQGPPRWLRSRVRDAPGDEPVSMQDVKPPPATTIAVGEPRPDSSEPTPRQLGTGTKAQSFERRSTGTGR